MNNPGRRPALFAALILFSFCFAAAQNARPGQSALAGIAKSIEAGKLAEAEPLLFAYVRANPNDAGGFAVFGRLRLKQNRLNEARSLLKKALTLDPSSAKAGLDLVSVHIGLGETAEARAALDGISGTAGLDSSDRLAAATAFLRIGDCGEALRNADLLPAAVRNRDALALRAECYIETGNAESLAGLLPTARSLVRGNAPVVIAVAEAISRRGLHRETVDLLKPLIAADPKNVEARLLAARSEIVLKNLDGARVHLAAAGKIAPETIELSRVQAFFESELGNFGRAVDILESVLSRVPDDVQALMQLVVAAMKANQSAKAVRAAESMLAIEPDNPDYIYLLGAAALQQNSLGKAETALTRYLELRPADSRGCLALGLAYAAQAEKLDRALEQMRKCLVIDPNNFEAAYQLGLAYKTQGESERSVAYFEQTVRLSPRHAYALKELGIVYLQSGDEVRARRNLESAAALIPNDADVHFQLSRLYNLIGERELAKKHLELFQKLRDRKSGGM